MLANPRILILDEATSSVDAEAEYLIQQALDEVMRGRTALVIAHRLSTIRNADKIVALDGGRIREISQRGELLQRGGLYSQPLPAPTRTSGQRSARREGELALPA